MQCEQNTHLRYFDQLRSRSEILFTHHAHTGSKVHLARCYTACRVTSSLVELGCRFLDELVKNPVQLVGNPVQLVVLLDSILLLKRTKIIDI